MDFPWLAAGLRHECRFGFFSAYNLILILLFGICGSDFCFQMGGYFFDLFGFVLSTQSLQIFRFPFQGLCDNPVYFLISGCLLNILQQLYPDAQFCERIFVWFVFLICDSMLACVQCFCFPLFFTRKRNWLTHYSHSSHLDLSLRRISLVLGLSSLCLYYSTYFLFCNPECCIKQTNAFGTKRRTPS